MTIAIVTFECGGEERELKVENDGDMDDVKGLAMALIPDEAILLDVSLWEITDPEEAA